MQAERERYLTELRGTQPLKTEYNYIMYDFKWYVKNIIFFRVQRKKLETKQNKTKQQLKKEMKDGRNLHINKNC